MTHSKYVEEQTLFQNGALVFKHGLIKGEPVNFFFMVQGQSADSYVRWRARAGRLQHYCLFTVSSDVRVRAYINENSVAQSKKSPCMYFHVISHHCIT